MTRDELIKAIYDSNGMRQCPGVYCELVRNCMKCAEKQLAEHEAKVRAEVADMLINETNRLINSYGVSAEHPVGMSRTCKALSDVFRHYIRVANKLKEQKE